MKWTRTEQAVRMARALAAEQVSWFAPALFSARLVVTEACLSLAAIDDGLRVYFNPVLVEEMLARGSRDDVLSELAWVWVHEISHYVRDHASRARDLRAAPLRWNIACDCEINDEVDWGELTPPRRYPPLVPACFGWPSQQLAEHYYRQLPTGREELLEQLQSLGIRGDDEGSGVHGTVRPWELDPTDDGLPAVSALEQKAVRREVAEGIAQAASRGDVPAGWVRWAVAELHPKVNWRDVLRRRVKGAITESIGARADYRFDRPHRRASVYAPILRPSLSAESNPTVACVVDTSGSMSPDELARALAEVAGVLEALRTPVTVIPCDCAAYDATRVLSRADLVALAKSGLQGGGGTDMAVGIGAALALRPTPEVVLVLTDGYTPYPEAKYQRPVIFGLFETVWGPAPKPPTPPWNERDIIVIERN